MLDLKGKTLGRYLLIEPLGEGGMAVVYKGYDATLERNVAIKVIRTEMGSDPQFLQRFQREAKALAHLDHPFILKVLDYGEQEGMPYLVMPFVSGGTLKNRMNHVYPPADAARILAPIARALAYAHQQGIIHRDVKPANILITPSGDPTLSDFGIAKILEQEGAQQLTGTGVGIGTPDYMAPEQWLGNTDARTDIYALGIILYEMVTGRLPYIADTPAAVLLKHMQDPLPRPRDFVPGLPETVEKMLFKALAKEPSARYPEMGQFAEALERLANENFSTAESVPEPSRAQTVVSAPSGSPPTPPPASRNLPPSAAPERMPPTPPAAGATGAGAASAARRKMPLLVIALGAISLLAVICVIGVGSLLLARFNPLHTNQVTPTSAVFALASAPTLASTETPTQTAPAQPTATQAQPEPPTPTAIAPTNTAAAQPSAASQETRLAPITKIDGMPEDLPILKDNNGDLMQQDTAEMIFYMYSTSLGVDETADFFRKEMARLGWKVTNTTTLTSPKAVMVTYEKDTRTVMVNAADSDGKTMVQMMLPKDISAP